METSIVDKSLNGRFKKGERRSPATEFKKGEHWREHKPYWDKVWLENEYTNKKRSTADIANQFGVRDTAILFWLKKHGISTRTTSQTRAIKHWGASGKDNPMYGMTGGKNHNWKGGCTPERQLFYVSQEWAEAASTVWKRDKAHCVNCGASSTERKLHIHHIVSFSVAELRTDVNNLILLCFCCHRWVHSKKNSKKLYIKEVQ